MSNKNRFKNWKNPKSKIKDGKPTKWHWIVKGIKNFKLGNKTDIGAFTYIQAQKGVTIEDYVEIGGGCRIYSVSTIDGKAGHVHLKKNCKIGAGSTILPGVVVGENSIVGAHSLVKNNIPDNVIAFGCPAKVIKKLIKTTPKKI